jgi:glycosyltransferase involved in cell wall biosynthesis
MRPAQIKVSVLIPTYNHREYIISAVDSALRQRTNFAVEIIISEDFSTDGTREIVQDLAITKSDRIRLLLSDKNIKSNEVVARGLRIARGKYVALLDGDDCWLSEDKLERQADYLDAHDECSAHFDNALVAVGGQVTKRKWTSPQHKTFIDLSEIWLGNPFATCAGMMRSRYINTPPPWYAGFFPITDWPLYILCAEHGVLAFADEASGLYRLHSGGQYSALGAEDKLDHVEKFYRRMNECLQFRYNKMARGGCSRYFFDWACEHIKRGELRRAASCLRRCLRGGGVGDTVSAREVLSLGAKLVGKAVIA